MGRVCAIGLDSASLPLIEELAAGGTLPNFRSLGARSVRHRLASGPGHRHGTLWSQFVHGDEIPLDRTGFRCRFDPLTYEPVEECAHHELTGRTPFWETTSAATITLDVPRTTISGPGVHVTAWGAHAPSYARSSQPRGLLREIDRRFGPHPGFGNEHDCGWHDPPRLEQLTRALEIGARRRAEIAGYLMDRFSDWRLFVTVMSEPHAASELMWHGIDVAHPLASFDAQARGRLTRVFVAVDDALGTLIRSLRTDDTVILFSLDGMQSSHGDLPSIVLLPELLHRDRFGAPLLRDPDQAAWRRVGHPPVVPRVGDVWRWDLDRRLVAPAPWPERLLRSPTYRRARLSPAGRRVIAKLKRVPIGALGIPIPPESDASPTELEAADQPLDEILFVGHYRRYRPRMRSFALPSFGDGYLRINLQGRERDGRVPIAEYDDERRRLDALIGACRDPRTGRPVADAIEWFDASTALEPDRRPYADGIVHWTHPTDAFEHPELGTIGPFPLHRTGTHTDLGFAWIARPGGVTGDGAPGSVLDLPPTILQAVDPEAPPPPAGVPIA